ncbi:MAG: glycosyltransferase family 4 protein [Terriglobales bacterium]
MAKWLQARGHKVTVLTGFPNYPIGRIYPGYRLSFRQWDEVEGVNVLRVPLYSNHDRSAFRRTLNYMSFAASASLIGLPSVGKVDVIYGMSTPPTVGLPPLLDHVFNGVPYVFNVADIWPDAVRDSGMIGNRYIYRVAEAFLKWLCATVYAHAAYVTTITEGYKKILVERGVPEQKVHAIYNWIDESLLAPQPRDSALARDLEFEGKFTFLYAGNLGALQGLDTIIRAAALLQHVHDIQVMFMGSGALEGELRRLAADLNLSNVRFAGTFDQRKMQFIYPLAEVLLIHLNDAPYLRATVPGKTQASLAVARPVLMAARGESAEMIRKAGAGMTCAPSRPEELAATMLEMYHLAVQQREAMGSRGREYYLKNMSLEVGAGRIEQLLQWAAASA